MEPAPRFEVEGMVVERPKGRRVISGLDLHLEAGEWVDLDGPSGCGKSTLLLALARLLPRVAGRMRLEGQSAEDCQPPRWRARVTYVAQSPVALPGTVEENLLAAWRLRVHAGRALPDRAGLRSALNQVGLGQILLSTRAAQLSGGELARVALLRAWLIQPEVLLLDEPDAMLDEGAADAVWALLSDFCSRGGSILRVSHHSHEGAGRSLAMKDGLLAEDS